MNSGGDRPAERSPTKSDPGAATPQQKNAREPESGRNAAKDRPAAIAPSRLSPAIAFVQRGRALFEQGKYPEAIAEFDQATNADPKWAPAYAWRCYAHNQLGAYADSILNCNQAVQLDPKNITALITRGYAYLGVREAEQALADFNLAGEINPLGPGPYAGRAAAYSAMGDQGRALKELNAAIQIDPKYPNSYGQLGGVYNRLQQYDKAVDAFSKGLQIRPHNFGVLDGRGIAYVNLEQSDLALADFNGALEINPNDAVAFGYRGRVYVEKAENNLAIADLTDALRIAPNIPSTLLWRARAYEAAGSLDKARADFQAVLDLNPAHGVARAGVDRIDAKLAVAKGGQVPARRTGVRVALVVGNAHYAAVDTLENAGRDARLISDTLKGLGFLSVDLIVDGSRDKLAAALKSFSDLAATADWAVIYYAGHGIEFEGNNYLVPTDVKYEQDQDIPKESIALDLVLNAVSGASKLRLVILDACRENPFITDMKRVDPSAVGRGLARIEPESGTLVAFATKHGNTASDGTGVDSPFAVALANRIGTPGLEVNQVFRLVHDDVYAATVGQQEPFTYGQLWAQQFYFK